MTGMSVGTALTAGVSPFQKQGRRTEAHDGRYGRCNGRASPEWGSLDRLPRTGEVARPSRRRSDLERGLGEPGGPPSGRQRVEPFQRPGLYGSSVPARIACSSSGSIRSASGAAASPSALSAQEAAPRLRSDQDAAAPELESQEALAQLASLHDASAQDAESHDASAHDAASHEAEAQEAFAFAVDAQLAASKIVAPETRSATTNLRRALFAVGGLENSTDRPALTSPTPSDMSFARGIGLAPAISAPLTWSGEKVGCRPSTSAAMPVTIGAANDVPESSM